MSEQIDFNFCAVGDWEHTEATREVSRNISTHHDPKFILNLGDFAYDSRERTPEMQKEVVDKWFGQYIKPMVDANIPQYCVLGNHDIRQMDYYLYKFKELNPEFNKWIYHFTKQNIFFLMLNTEAVHTPTSDQYNYAQDILARTFPDYPDEDKKIKGVTWRIVCFHRPIYCSRGGHGPFESFQHFHQLFDKYKVDIVLSGHNHNYERSYPLSYNTEDPDKPRINDTRRNDYLDTLGSIFVNVGTGGHSLNDLITCEPHFYEQFDEDHGHLMIGLREQGTKIECKFYDRNIQGHDYFSIKKTFT